MTIVIERCNEVQVFVNEAGSVTILQVADYGEEDAIVIFPIDKIDAVVSALRALKDD